jgi:type VI secretion system protein ImpE
MTTIPAAEQSLRDGDPGLALQQLEEQVRACPADSKARIFLFQLLAVLGQWDRALTHLKVAADLDVSALAMAQMYGEAIHCEMWRAQVFSGNRSPMIFGQPEQWVALLIESLRLSCCGQIQQSEQLRKLAFDQAPASTGTIDGKPYRWIADADLRFGPVLEAIIQGRYYWAPFSRFSEIIIDAPEDLRDLVWMPAHFRFSNGGVAVGLIPTRYPGSESDCQGVDAQAAGELALARKTAWNEVAPDNFQGLGQRVIATDAGEVALMDIRHIKIDPPKIDPPGTAASDKRG